MVWNYKEREHKRYNWCLNNFFVRKQRFKRGHHGTNRKKNHYRNYGSAGVIVVWEIFKVHVRQYSFSRGHIIGTNYIIELGTHYYKRYKD